MSLINVVKVQQKPWHCGPAVVEMMLCHADVNASQEAITDAAGMTDTIIGRGCRIDELTQAVETLAPKFAFLAKYNSTIEDMRVLVEEYGLPSGIEWRATLLEPDGCIWEEGHYTLVIGVDYDKNTITMIDPFYPGTNISHIDGVIDIDEFERRWWDWNDIPAEAPEGDTERVWNQHLLFVLAPSHLHGPLQERGFQRASVQLMRDTRLAEIEHLS